jgi:AAA+ ATPase superfamily predicted ATPase
MKFINRINEMQRLNNLINLPEASVAVIWGRRRIGKTRLLIEWAQKHGGVYFTADESASAVQKKYFCIAMEKVLSGFSQVEYPDWTTLFSRLAKEASYQGWKGPLIIDELPYLISTSPELPSVLQKFIDHEAKQAGLIMALCGSSQRMMQGAILDASAPLYGRAQELIKLKPISIGYMKEALELGSFREIVEYYSVFGGIPRYWELLRSRKGHLFEKINELVLDPMGPLNEEPQRLLMEEMPSAIILRPILDAIGLGARRLSEIAARIGMPVTSFSRQLHRLMELDLIKREVPFGEAEHNSKKALYKIKDPFVRFWFEIVAPRRSFLNQSLPKARWGYLKEFVPQIFELAWEELCQEAVPYLSDLWGDIDFGQGSRYWHKQGNEWDILSFSQNGKYLLIGEAKWTAKTPSAHWIYKTIEEMKAKGAPPVLQKKKIEFVFALFVPEKPEQLVLADNVKVIDAKELVSKMR